jgi:hypothetical protein
MRHGCPKSRSFGLYFGDLLCALLGSFAEARLIQDDTEKDNILLMLDAYRPSC